MVESHCRVVRTLTSQTLWKEVKDVHAHPGSRTEPTENSAEPESDRRKRTKGTDAGPAPADPEQAFTADDKTVEANRNASDFVDGTSESYEEAALVLNEKSDTDRQPAESDKRNSGIDRQTLAADLFTNANLILDDYEFDGPVLEARR